MYYMSEKVEDIRHARRKEHHSISCCFDGESKSFKVYELSAYGFSFLCSKDSPLFRRGVMLDEISIHNSEGVEIILASGKIVHATEFDFETNRFGVHYTKKVLDRTITGKVRVPRHVPEFILNAFLNLPDDKNGWRYTGYVKDFTATTARIGFENSYPIDMKIGDDVFMSIYAGSDELVYSKAQVVRKREDGTEIIIRLNDQLIDIARIKTVTTAFQNKKIISSAINSLHSYDNVSDSYKALVADWRLYFQRLKRVLDQEENKKNYRFRNEEEYFIQGIEDEIFEDLRSFVTRLNSFGDSLSKLDSIAYKQYFKENIGPYLRCSPLIASIIDKDLGYAGDFETIKQFFQNPYCGDTLFGKLLNKFICSLEAVTAHQDRIRFLFNELNTTYNTLNDEFSFMSLGSGPAEEVLRFVSSNDFNKNVHATLLDMDSYALADFSDRMQYLPKDNFIINLINIDIMNIIRRTENDPVSDKHSITYCAGLFDYFGKKICQKLIRYLISHTKPGGKIIVTNVHENNIARHFMNYGGGWEIIHRNEEDMKNLIPDGYDFELFSDDKDTNLYVVISVR